jgi:hypothetical protein
MSILRRDEFIKAMEDDYTPKERARNRMYWNRHARLVRRINKLRERILGWSLKLLMMNFTCRALPRWGCLFRWRMYWHAKIGNHLSPPKRSYKFLRWLEKRYPSEVLPIDHIKKGVLDLTFDWGEQNLKWEKVFKNE